MQRKTSIFEFNHMVMEMVATVKNQDISILIEYTSP